MSKFQFPINAMKKVTGTALLTAAVAGCYFAVMPGLFTPSPKAKEAQLTTVEHQLPHRPAGGRRWRASNAEQSQATLAYFGDDDPWGRNRERLEGAMSLFQMGATFSSAEIGRHHSRDADQGLSRGLPRDALPWRRRVDRVRDG